MSQATSGYYFFSNCPQCKGEVILGEAPSPAEEEYPKSRSILMTCPHCGAEHTYSPKEMAVGEMVEEKKAAQQQPDGLKFEGV